MRFATFGGCCFRRFVAIQCKLILLNKSKPIDLAS
jgi:hypothetical protein